MKLKLSKIYYFITILKRNCIMLNVIIAFSLIFIITNYSATQTIQQLRKNKKLIISTLKTQQDKKELKKALSLFDKKSLKNLLQNFNLLTKKEKTKNELINSIIENLPIIIEKEKEINLPFFKRNEYKKEIYSKDIPSLRQSRNFIIYKAAKLFFIDKKDNKGFRQLILFGQVNVKFGSSNIEADLVSIKINDENKPIEAFALGNILIKERNNRITGKKIYFFPKTSRALMIAPIAYFNPFYFTAETGKKLEKEKYKFSNGIMTNDDVYNLHYKITFSDAWYYSEEFIWANNVTYVVGDSNMFWTPFILRSSLVTGILNTLGYREDIGWYTNNTLFFIPGENIITTRKKKTNSISGQNLGMMLKLDYYQRLGIYLGTQININIQKLNLNIDTGIAYDRSLDYINNRFTNSFDHVNYDGIPEETNNFRWTFDINGNYRLFSAPNSSTTISAHFKTQSDPYFKKQFNTERSTQFDLIDILPIFDEEVFDHLLSGGSSENQNIGFNINTNIYRLNLSITGNFNYYLQLDLTDPSKLPLNEYDVSSYKQYKSSFTFPNINLSYSDSIQIIGRKTTTKKNTDEKNYIQDFLDKDKTQTEIDKENEEKKENEKKENEKKENEKDIFEELKTEENLTISMPLNFRLNTSITETQTYKTGEDNTLDTDIFSTSSNFNLSLPFTIAYKFIRFSIASSGNIYYKARQTKKPNASEQKNDEELSYPSWNTSIASSLDFSFFKEYKYLELNFGGGVTYSKADRFTDPIKENDTYKNLGSRSENISYNSYLNFLKTKLSVSFGDNLYINPYDMELINQGIKTKKEILKEQRGNLSFSLSSNPFDFISVSNSLNYSRKKEELIGNSLNISINFNDIKIYQSSIIKSISLSTSWYNDFKNPIYSNLNVNFQLNFYITKYWNLIYNVSVSNNQLYQYNEEYAKKYGKIPRNFFQDLLDSFNFFDTKARQRSLFKLNYLNLVLNHDLHEWTLQFKLNFRFKEFRTGVYYFEPALYILLYLKDMPSIKYPEVEKVFTKQ